MNTDSLANTRPIHQAAETPAQIQELFDGIAYGKAAAVLRMLEAYLGEETFRAGVNAYIAEASICATRPPMISGMRRPRLRRSQWIRSCRRL